MSYVFEILFVMITQGPKGKVKTTPCYSQHTTESKQGHGGIASAQLYIYKHKCSSHRSSVRSTVTENQFATSGAARLRPAPAADVKDLLRKHWITPRLG